MRHHPALSALCVALLVCATLARSDQALAQQPSGTPPPVQGPPPVSLSALIDQTVAVFPTVKADVAEVHGQTLTITAGASSGAIAGLLLEVYREGREIRNPRTGEVLGREERTIGHAVVTQAFDRYSVATFEGSEAAAPADRVSTPAGKIKLMLLSLNTKNVKGDLVEAATNEVYEGLLRTGRFNVVLGDQVALWLEQQHIKAEDVLAGQGIADAAKKFHADNVLVLYFRQVERKPFMDVRLFTTTRPAAAVSTAFFVPPSVKPLPPGRFSASDRYGQTPEVKPRSLLARLLGGLLGGGLGPGTYSSDTTIPLKEIGRFGFPMISMDVAVAPADKTPRLVLTDGERIWTYKIVDGAMTPEWTFYERTIGRIYSVQFASLTGDGTLQVVANRFDTRVGMNSLIVGLQNGKPTALANEIDSLLLAVDEKGTGVKQTLWGAPYDERTFFTKGHADRLVLRDGKVVKDGTIPVPDNFRMTGATMSNVMGKKHDRVLAFIDERGQLELSSGVENQWTSSSVMGGAATKIEVERHIERSGRSYFYQLQPIPLAIDLDGDGIEEIVVPQNQVEGMLGVVYHGPAGIRFQQVNSGFDGTITGIGGFPDENGGTPTLIATVVHFRNFAKSKGETQIIMTLGD